MGLFDKIFKEIARPFKQTVSEIARVDKKIFREIKRVDKQLLDVIFPKPPEVKLPPLPAPSPTQVTGRTSDETRRRQRKRVSGRRKTIVTGELSPKTVGKKTLLGR